MNKVENKEVIQVRICKINNSLRYAENGSLFAHVHRVDSRLL